ncbi:GGDEF domain-containing protein [Novosphingobium sp. PASSN1]|uniref:GGDEF domain-containing protein n=1 Tax=Novosphingobium sp. PASSN1 TaxID=2015561 RepID=UPI000BD52502|nr:GGDEF domain-containing protein [Novosphingobium sp. PASSN1]OYU37039.1 MAG: GGDEF domain-containing protein [Novosphingobium sp. PASSN1]
MSEQTSDESARKSRWWQWFSGSTAEDAAEPELDAAAPRELTAREVWLPAKRRMISKIADFLIDHDLEVLPATLTVAYECVTGGAPRLAQLILERTEKGLPITLGWIEEQRCESTNDKNSEALAVLLGRLEGSLDEFSKTTTGARTATSEYSSALRQHVDDLEGVGRAGVVITELAALTRAMMERSIAIETELACSERRAQSLQTTLEETRKMADMDHLTGLPNRRAFDHMLEREMREAVAAGESLCVAFVDIDHFKRVNDTHGHPAGDRVLKFVGETLNRIADARCFVARHGGEEFAVIWRNHTIEKAFRKLDAAREEIAERRLVNRANDSPFGKITFSGGIADVFAYPEKSAALKAADEALYAAKESGRNRILRAGESPDPQAQAA